MKFPDEVSYFVRVLMSGGNFTKQPVDKYRSIILYNIYVSAYLLNLSLGLFADIGSLEVW